MQFIGTERQRPHNVIVPASPAPPVRNYNKSEHASLAPVTVQKTTLYRDCVIVPYIISRFDWATHYAIETTKCELLLLRRRLVPNLIRMMVFITFILPHPDCRS